MFTKRQFLKFGQKFQHRKCAELLRKYYETLRERKSLPFGSWETYNALLSWMRLPSFENQGDLKAIADQYHWHLTEAGRSLKEHNLLPTLRTGDRTPQCDFLPNAIYLDQIRSAYNVGSILRTAEALRIGSVYFSQRTPFIDNEKVTRTAMGAAEWVPCFQNVSIRELPRPILALDTSDEAIPLGDYLFPRAFTLILGNEEYGISEEGLAAADLLLEIPLCGAKNSLNVACAFAIAAAEIRRQAREGRGFGVVQ